MPTPSPWWVHSTGFCRLPACAGPDPSSTLLTAFTQRITRKEAPRERHPQEGCRCLWYLSAVGEGGRQHEPNCAEGGLSQLRAGTRTFTPRLVPAGEIIRRQAVPRSPRRIAAVARYRVIPARPPIVPTPPTSPRLTNGNTAGGLRPVLRPPNAARPARPQALRTFEGRTHRESRRAIGLASPHGQLVHATCCRQPAT